MRAPAQAAEEQLASLQAAADAAQAECDSSLERRDALQTRLTRGRALIDSLAAQAATWVQNLAQMQASMPSRTLSLALHDGLILLFMV